MEVKADKMLVPFLADVLSNGIISIQFAIPILKALPWLVLIYFLKLYFGGATNTSERLMHSKVIMITVLNSPLHWSIWLSMLSL